MPHVAMMYGMSEAVISAARSGDEDLNAGSASGAISKVVQEEQQERVGQLSPAHCKCFIANGGHRRPTYPLTFSIPADVRPG